MSPRRRRPAARACLFGRRELEQARLAFMIRRGQRSPEPARHSASPRPGHAPHLGARCTADGTDRRAPTPRGLGIPFPLFLESCLDLCYRGAYFENLEVGDAKGARLTPQVLGQGYPTRVSAQNWGALNVPLGAQDGGRDPLREGRRRAADSREGNSPRR